MCTPKLSEGPGAEVVVVTKGCAPALSAVGCAMYHVCSWKGDLVAGGGGADGAAVSIHLWPHLWGCEIAGSGSAAAHTHAWAFWAADHALGAACLPELALPLYGSGCCKQDCLQLSSPMHCVAGGSGDKAAAACGHFCQVTPICLVVSVHECWLGAICSLSGSRLSKEQALQTRADKCASTMWRLWTVPRDKGVPSLRKPLETEITFSKMAMAAVSLCASGKPSNSGGVTAESTVAGAGVKSIGCSSTVQKSGQWWQHVCTASDVPHAVLAV
jgi:hypothetical protein